MISSEVAPRVREFIKGRDRVAISELAMKGFGQPFGALRPVERAILEVELHDRAWRCVSRKDGLWVNDGGRW